MKRSKINKKKVSFPIRGDSMYPTIKKGRKIFVKKIHKVKSGNIIVFLNTKNALVIHRVIKIKGLLFTKGDNNEECDSFGIQQIIGKVLIKEKFAKKIMYYFKAFQKARKSLREAKKKSTHLITYSYLEK